MRKAVERWLIMLMAAVALVNFSCSKKQTGCQYDACSFVAPDAEVKQVEAYLASKNITAVKHCSGMYYHIDNTGTGSTPTACSAVLVTYKGSLTNGKVFDQTANPVSFSLLNLITAWKNGLPLIEKGGKILLYVPPTLGYGSVPNGDIPANSVLIFDVDLLDFR